MDSKRNVNNITIKPMINLDGYKQAQGDFIAATCYLFIISFFSIAAVIGLVYRWDAIRSTLGL